MTKTNIPTLWATILAIWIILTASAITLTLTLTIWKLTQAF